MVISSINRIIESAKYRWFARKALRCCFPSDKLIADGYISQFGQDKWIAETLLPGKQQGIFVDIGANDGISISNTCYLEKQLGWNGLAVEPIPEINQKLRTNRKCIIVEGCVGPKNGKITFQRISGYPEMLSGIKDEYHALHNARINAELKEYGGAIEEIDVDCYRFNDLMNHYNIKSIDYLNIDTEGAELTILESIDFEKINIKVIGVENNYCDYRIPKLLVKHGYQFHSIVGDEFYVKS